MKTEIVAFFIYKIYTMKEMLYEVKSNEDMILALAGQFKQLLKFKTIA